MTADQDVSSALADVRRAYRLLHSFHQRTNDIFRDISAGVGKEGLGFTGWGPVHFRRPRSRKRAPWDGRWAWDLLPGYGIGAFFETSGRTRGVRSRLLVQIIADSGFAKSAGEPDPATFEAADRSISVVQMSLMRARGPVPSYDEAKLSMDAVGVTLFDGNEHRLMLPERALTYRWFDIGLEELPKRTDIQVKVVAPLRQWLRLDFAP